MASISTINWGKARRLTPNSVAEGLPLSDALDNAWLQANYSVALGSVAHEQGDYGEAYRLLYEGVRTAQTTGDPHLISFCGSLFTRTAQVLGQAAETEDVLHEGLALAQDTGDRWSMGMRLERMAVAAQTRGDHAEARRLFDASANLFDEIGDPWSRSRALNLLGHFALEAGDLTLARDSFVKAGRAAMAAHVTPFVLDALAGLAALNIQEECYEAALEIVFHVRQHPAATHNAQNLVQGLQTQLAMHSPSHPAEPAGRSFEALVAEVLSLPHL